MSVYGVTKFMNDKKIKRRKGRARLDNMCPFPLLTYLFLHVHILLERGAPEMLR